MLIENFLPDSIEAWQKLGKEIQTNKNLKEDQKIKLILLCEKYLSSQVIF